jgi:hypothetical protein
MASIFRLERSPHPSDAALNGWAEHKYKCANSKNGKSDPGGDDDRESNNDLSPPIWTNPQSDTDRNE